jgi:hypothetical protein
MIRDLEILARPSGNTLDKHALTHIRLLRILRISVFNSQF